MAAQPLHDILFIHQNMPAQFRHLAPALARAPGVRVSFLTCRDGVEIKGVNTLRYRSPAGPRETSDGLLAPVESAVRYGRAVLMAGGELRSQGYRPRLVIAHPGWGEALFLREIWPEARILTYGEYYYRSDGGDTGFDPQFPTNRLSMARTRMMNTHLLLAHEQADAILSPTQWQKDRHPAFLREKTSVIFDGIDTRAAAPQPGARYALPNGRTLDADDEVITYVARNLEPHRGFHILMRALPALLAARPKARVVIVGGDNRSYSPVPPAPHESWRAALLSEIDLGAAADRVCFTGQLAYRDYLALLAVSSVHVYLTYPFVLSWSCLEAMAAGCLLVASDTGPVREIVSHGDNGLLFPFFDATALVDTVCAALDDPARGPRLRAAARATILDRYDLPRCLMAQGELIQGLLAG